TGDLLCVLDDGVRGTSLAQAEAQLVQAQADFDANERLLERGFTTQSRLRQLKAALDAAKAAVATAKQEVTRTEVRATAAGMVQQPFAEVGDNLASGGVCATLLQPDPMLFTGQISERNVASVQKGMKATVELVGQRRVEGVISYISPVADANTRTFNMEVEIPNPDRSILDGLTAEALIDLQPTEAYQVEPSWLTLADDGKIGVRAVGAGNEVEFHPVTILEQGPETLWVSGLKPNLKVITLGQNFVVQGATVEPVTAAQMEALEKAKAAEQAAQQTKKPAEGSNS
ncbi:MAG: efflux RND transporter periplasmic adaptor subunit, partial [Pseudomonadota bacterium]